MMVLLEKSDIRSGDIQTTCKGHPTWASILSCVVSSVQVFHQAQQIEQLYEQVGIAECALQQD